MLGRFQPTNGEACDSGCSTRRIVPGSWSNPGVVTRTLGTLGFGRARVGGAFKLVAGALACIAYGHRADIETNRLRCVDRTYARRRCTLGEGRPGGAPPLPSGRRSKARHRLSQVSDLALRREFPDVETVFYS